MRIGERQLTAKNLEKNGQVRIGKDLATVRNGLIYIETKGKLIHPLYGTLLENPMTWDTFTHLYLLDK